MLSLDYSTVKMHLWQFNGSVLRIKEKLQVVFAFTVRDIHILVVYADGMYGAFVILAGLIKS